MNNQGIMCMGADIVKHYLEIVALFYKKPIVSVGSGLASIEYETIESAKHKGNLIDFICVDPDPISYSRDKEAKPLISPSFPLVKNLIAAKPEIIGDCVLFLNWCLPNESVYDYEAIELLKPVAVVSVYEVYMGGAGGAGGEDFHRWLQATQRESDGEKMIDDKDISKVSSENDKNIDDPVDESGDKTDVGILRRLEIIPFDSEVVVESDKGTNEEVDTKIVKKGNLYIEIRTTCVEDDENAYKSFDPRISWFHRKDLEKPSQEIINQMPFCVEARTSTAIDWI